MVVVLVVRAFAMLMASIMPQTIRKMPITIDSIAGNTMIKAPNIIAKSPSNVRGILYLVSISLATSIV